MPPHPLSLLLWRTSLLGCFLGIVATLYFIAGYNGYLSAPLLNAAVAGSVLLAALYFLYGFACQLRSRPRLHLLLWFLVLGVLLAEVTLGLVPPWARDELTHHLAIPRLYASAGRIYEIPFAPYSYYPMLLDMLYTPFVLWHWDFVPKLVHGLFGFLTGLLLYAYLGRRLSPVYGLLAFFFYVTTPAVLRLMNWAYVDLGLSFFALASLLCLLQWHETQETRWLVICGLSAGFSAATKPNGLLVCLLLGFILVLLRARSRPGETLDPIAWGGAFVLLAFLPFAPWGIKNVIQTGNPLFPDFQGLFAANGGTGGGGISGGMNIWTTRALLYGESWWEMAALPLRVFLVGRDNNPQYFDGVLNPILFLFLPWAFKGKWTEEKKVFFWFAVLYFLYALFLVDMRIRYILPIVAPLVILLVYGIHNLYLGIRRPWILVVAVLLLTGWNGVYLLRYIEKVSPFGVVSGHESREAFLDRMVPDYGAIRYINENLPETAKIYFIFMGRRAYYCHRDYFHDAGGYPALLLRSIQRADSDGAVAESLRVKGLTHLLLREDLLGPFLQNNLEPEKQRLWQTFAQRHLRLVFRDGRYSVYSLHG